MRLYELLETTSAGAIATVSMPLGKVRKRMKDASVYEQDVANTYKYGSPKSAEDYHQKRLALLDIINSDGSDQATIEKAQDYLVRLHTEAREKGYLK